MVSEPTVVAASELLPLRIEGLHKRFGKVNAVDGVSLELHGGECLGMLGPNGAGKSTLLRSIVGRVIPDSGTVTVFGAAANSSFAREAMGWVPQDLALYSRLSCRENLQSFGRYHGLGGTALQESVRWCLDWAALTDRADELAKNLSGGMKRRLNMAAGMIHRPKLVLMDEPTVGVDPQSRNRIFEMIEKLLGEGMSIIYTTHYMEEAERLCTRIAIIDQGHVVAQGSKEELVQNSCASRSEVRMRIAGEESRVAEWAGLCGGHYADEAALFTVEHPTEIAGLLDEVSKAGLELVDVSLRRPNLESVFLQLTGRELRD